MQHYDIVHAADLRYRGGTASAVRGEIAGAQAWGVGCAILPYLGPRQRTVSGFDPRTSALLDATGLPILSPDDPATCDVLLAHHPNVFEALPSRPVALRPKRVVCVLHHPLFDGAHRQQYDLARITRALQATYAAPVVFAPVSPVVRAQAIKSGVPATWLLRHDLVNVLDERCWPERQKRAPRESAVIGRHSRADAMKWPATSAEILAAYPPDDRFDIRVLGGVTLPDAMPLPSNWAVRRFSDFGVADFLSELDFYVYFHHPDWVEAFGLAIAEAMVTGIVTLLPPNFEPMFEDGAVYCHPQDVKGTLDYLLQRPDEYARQSRAARRVILSRYSVATYDVRIGQLFDDLDLPRVELGRKPDLSPPRGSQRVAVPPAPRTAQRVLMVTGNGVGLGHITRLMAIAQHLPAWIEPVFLTLSLGTALLREAGFSADYFPTHRKLGVTDKSWNDISALDFLAMVEATGAGLVVFDGNCPWEGIVKVMELRRDIRWVWVRRSLWQPHQRLSERAIALFDMVIEPAELASDEDGGPTAGERAVEQVGPILLSDPADRADRDAALAHLGLAPDKPVVALQLGSQQNFSMVPVRLAVIETLKKLPVSVIEIENPLAVASNDPTDAPSTRRIFPLFPWSRAIDLMITAPGYNSFHENAFGSVPSIFVPNEASEMDDQLLRAAYAQSAGLGLMMTVADAPRAESFVLRGLAPDFAAMVRSRAAGLSYRNGAPEAARLISDFLLSVRTDRPLHSLLPRHRTY